MARWLGVFTAQDLADALRVPVELGDQFITALLWHEMVHETDDWVEGPHGVETIYELEPLPPGPNQRPRHTPPEISAVREFGGLLLYDLRGLPVRIRTERDQRRSLSTPGARQVHRNREREYERMQQAKAQRRIKDDKKRRALAEGKRVEEVT